MKKICFCIPYPDFESAECIAQRINNCVHDGDQVTVWYVDGSGVAQLEKRCSALNVQMHKLNEKQIEAKITILNRPFLISYAFLNLFRDADFDEIHFADLTGAGYHCIQAKKTGCALQNVELAVEMLGASQMCNEFSESWGAGGFEQLMVQHMERYCCQYCDRLIASDRGIVDWAENASWTLSESLEISPFMPCSIGDATYETDDACPIFFVGTLGKINGMHMFVNALQRLASSLETPRKIRFVGEYQMVDGLPSHEYIYEKLNGLPYEIEILGAFEADALVERIVAEHGYVVSCNTCLNAPSIMAIRAAGIPVLASNSASHRTIFAEETLFQSIPSVLVNLLKNPKFAKPIEQQRKTAKKLRTTHERSAKCAKVSLITAYFNHGAYLDMTRESVEAQTYQNIEWIIVNDGSTDEASVKLLDEYQKKYQDKPFKILHQTNSGPSIARNYGAQHASGQYLIFLDSDNVAKPDMVESFVDAMERSDCDCLSCYFDTIEGRGPVNKESLTGETYTLLGPSLETGAFANCFGDTNFIVKKSVFDAVGGFIPKRVVTEDWMILSRIALKNFKVDIIPDALFWYRVLPESNVGFGSEFEKQQQILRAYCEGLPPYVYHVFNSIARPSFEPHPTKVAENSPYLELFEKIDKMFPKGSRRRKLVKKLAKKVLK